MLHRSSILILIIAALVCAPAQADVTTGFEVLVEWSGGSWSSSDHSGSLMLTENGDGSYDVSFFGNVPGQWTALWFGTIDPDPYITGVASFTNGGSFEGTFNLILNLPTVSLAAPTNTSGSFSGSLLDNDGTGATLMAPTAGSAYTAIIDGITHKTMADDGSFGPITAGGWQTQAFGPMDFAKPGPALNSYMELRNAFRLSAHDSATIVSSFVVTPEPATIALLGCGLMLLRRPRRRA